MEIIKQKFVVVVYKYTAQCMETNMCVKHTNVFHAYTHSLHCLYV